MNETEQNIAVAEWMGWKIMAPDDNLDCALYGSISGSKKKRIPDFGKDLNAMAEAEQLLGDRISEYILKIMSISCNRMSHAVVADAATRRQALIKTIGKWEVGA